MIFRAWGKKTKGQLNKGCAQIQQCGKEKFEKLSSSGRALRNASSRPSSHPRRLDPRLWLRNVVGTL